MTIFSYCFKAFQQGNNTFLTFDFATIWKIMFDNYSGFWTQL